MIPFILVFIVCIALSLSLFLEIYTIFWSKSFKKNYFLLMQTMVIIYLLGYLLEITSINAEEAFAAAKILYLGSSFVSSFVFFFIADYCDIKLHPVFVRVPMVIMSAAITLAMWTNKFHHLIYLDYSFQNAPVHNLVFTPGSLYYLANTYPIICMILGTALLLYKIKESETKYRKRLLALLICLAIPFIAQAGYIVVMITGILSFHIHFTPFSLAIMSLCLYLGVVRFNMFDIISVAIETAMEHILEGFVLLDENNNYLFSNPAAIKIIPGITKLRNGESICSAAGWPGEFANLDNFDCDLIDFSTSTSGEGIRYFRASISPVFADNKAVMAKIILIRETTDSINLLKELENVAYIDALTGLYNRKHFFELANADIERAQRLNQTIYTAMLDLDFFKNVNDTYGHAAGDMVLKTTARVIRQAIRAYDLLCRYGGEEFVLLILDLEANEAFTLMERIREDMESAITSYEGIEIKITCSIGIAKFQRTDTLESSIKKSDEAMYIAKNSGRNQVKVFESEI